MMNLFAPSKHYQLIVDAFSDPERPSYGQVANVDKKGLPQIRTVHIHYLSQFEALGFNTHVKSNKWESLEKKPILSGCYVDNFRLVQFRWESKIELIHPDNKKYCSFLDDMWLKMREDVRRAYALENLGENLSDPLPSSINLQKRHPNQGVILCRPYLWNIYEMNEKDYTQGRVFLHVLEKDSWHSSSVSLLHGREQ